ncbi:MAG: hypothetical protein HYZ42_14585, partial [Bacteroidetes bacterium]|nr:hypothetical protein [Bacteroidota bacterium]
DTFYFPEGNIYIEAEIYDRMIFEPNRLAPKSYSLYINNIKSFECVFNTYTFDQNKYVNTHIDYDAYWDSGKRFQKLYRERESPMRFYNNSYLGYIELKQGESYDIRIEAIDFNGVKTHKKLILIHKKSSKILCFGEVNKPSITIENALLKYTYNSEDSNIFVQIQPHTFYERSTIHINGDTDKNRYTVDENYGSHQPFLNPISLKIKLQDSFLKMNTSKLYIGYETEDSKGIYCGGAINNKHIQTNISIPGNYFIGIDTLPPAIEMDSSTDNYLNFKISDNLSGIGFYKATINGIFALVSYDANNSKLIIKKNKYTPVGKYLLKITIADKRQNYNTWEGATVFE